MDVKAYVDSLRVGRVYRVGNMAVAPVFSGEREFPVYFLSEAFERGLEIADTGQVLVAVAENKAERDVVVVRGECFDGSSQKRMAVSHDYIERGARKNLDIRCVERFRCTSTGTNFSYGGLAPPSVRYIDGQGEVWDTVDTTLSSTGTRSRTSSLLETRKSNDVVEVSGVLDKELEDGWVGLVAVIGEGNERYAADIFADQRAAALFRKELIMSLAIESMRFSGTPRATENGINEFLYTLENSGWNTTRAEGKAKITSLNGNSIKGSALLIGDQPIHIGFINTQKPRQRPPTEIYGTEVGSSREQRVGAGKKESALVPV